MTASEVLLDTWAWREVLSATATGERLRRRHLGPKGRRVNTSALTLAEIGAQLAERGHADRLPSVVASLRAFGELHDVTPEIAQAAGPLRRDLRRRARHAGLIDALILATALRPGPDCWAPTRRSVAGAT